MPHPKDVFDHPDRHWALITAPTDKDFEDQCFDRKQVPGAANHGFAKKSDLGAFREEIVECLSAFANANPEGGLLVLGVATNGAVKGLSHLTDEQRQSITEVEQLLRNQATQVRFFECTNEQGAPDRICLMYVHYCDKGIVERVGPTPKAWMRQGLRNVFMTEEQKERLRRDKRIVDYENAYCSRFEETELDPAVMQEFRRGFLAESDQNYSDVELLWKAGALRREQDGTYSFNNAGYLFFAANPQRILPAAHIRLLRFGSSQGAVDRGLPTYDREFTGPITSQVRQLRTFLKESAFFKTYQRRNPDGGFSEEPEYPLLVVDEAVVNAVVHRDYAMTVPVTCESYADALVVTNAGRVLQRALQVPDEFSLNQMDLDSTPRNPKLVQWLKHMKDERGRSFIQALSEGTKRMRAEMERVGLPSPLFRLGEAQTTVILLNNAREREAGRQWPEPSKSTEFANLFPLKMQQLDRPPHHGVLTAEPFRRNVIRSLTSALEGQGWFVDSDRYGELVAHQRGAQFPVPEDVAAVVRFYPGYIFQVRDYWGAHYLCVDYTVVVKNILSARALLSVLPADDLVGRSVTAQFGGRWHLGKIVNTDEQQTRVFIFGLQQEHVLPSDKVIPNLPAFIVERILEHRRINFDVPKAIKQHSLSLDVGAARKRSERLQAVVSDLAEKIFPLTVQGGQVLLEPDPVHLVRGQQIGGLRVSTINEPRVEFNRQQEDANIREGITKFGSFDYTPKIIEIVPVCSASLRGQMTGLLERLKVGKFRFRGFERTFSTRITYQSVVTTSSAEESLAECKRLLAEHPDWIGNKEQNRQFLVHAPEQGYRADDENAPYYQIKRLLLEAGIPCQMVDTPTLLNPDYKDLNLALNIAAKCGITPWVLPDAIPDADFFVGLSYTQSGRNQGRRLMGYANVFNQYGRWEFYSGNTEPFPYEERREYLASLVARTLGCLPLSETPSIYFHYSAKFSKEDRQAILRAARTIRPKGTYYFVWINSHHHVRLFDSRPETDGSLSRGSFVEASPHRIYLSTTGSNPYRKVLGTPNMLEITVWVEPPDGRKASPPDLRALAVQVLSLTKLNWASTDSLCAEPITTKYAGDIAYLTAAFLRQGRDFKLHPVLERTPWFI